MSKNTHPEDVKAAVRKTGISLAELARRNGISSEAARGCLRFPSPTANRAVAKHLGIPVHELWPEWFDENGDRILSGTYNRITESAPTQRQKRSAA